MDRYRRSCIGGWVDRVGRDPLCRRNKVFQAQIDPEINALKDSVISKYRERFGKDPTGPYLTVQEPSTRGRLAKKS